MSALAGGWVLCAALGLAGPAAAQPVVAPIGDGGSVGVTVQNRSVHPLPIALGPVGAEGVAATLERYAEGGFAAQCVAGGRGETPRLTVTIDHRATVVDVPPIGFPDGPPVLWLSDQRAGRAALQAVIEGSIPGAAVEQLALEAVPITFAGLRFARAILISAADFARLEPVRRQAVVDAVSAGATLVVGTGEAGAATDALRPVASIGLGDVRRPTGVLAAHLSRASARRALAAEGDARVRMVADGEPVLVEARRGLGLVRVIGVRFAELQDGALARAALTPPAEPLGHVLRWLAQAPPPGETRASPFGAHIWLLLTVLVGLVMLTRRRPRLALAVAIPWWVVALALPPQWTDTRLDAARVLYVPVPDGALAIGSLDLTLTRGGPRTLDAGVGRVALEDASPGGACLVSDPRSAGWIVDGEAGTPRRLTFFARVDHLPEGDDKLGELPEWPPGALAGGTLRRVADGPLPLEITAREQDAVRVEPRVAPAVAPAILGEP